MDKELIERMARDAGFEVLQTGNASTLVEDPGGDCLTHFATSIADECVKMIERYPFSSRGAAFDGMTLVSIIRERFKP